VTRLKDDGAAQVPRRPRLVVPAYFHPAVHRDQWEWLAGHAPLVRLVILNIQNGPGGVPQAPFKEVTGRLRDAGVPVIGYVDTSYGRRPAAEALADLGRYQDWYGVSGVCLDRAATSPAHLAHYATLTARARQLGAEVVFFNHGAHPHEGYAEHADLLGTFEGPWHLYRTLSVPRWTTAWPAEKFYHVVYSVPPGLSGRAVRLAGQRHAAAVYITERGGPNPYDRLPADLRNLICQRQPGSAAAAALAGRGGWPPCWRSPRSRPPWPR
jgi:hypothetical protein